MQRSNNYLLRNWLILIGVLVILFLIGKFYWGYLKSPVDPNGQIQVFVIERGESTGEIANRLEGKGLIRSARVFTTYLLINRSMDKIQAGDFKLSSKMSLDEIFRTLSSGPIDIWITLIEGWRVEEIAKRLKHELGSSEEDFLEVAEEGYMFPDTYLFNPDATAADVASIMKNNFEKKYTKELQIKIQKLGLTPEEGVILASIVEREGRSDKVRKEVASILLKRLNIGMKLDVDATVQYAKDTQTLKQNKGKIDKFWRPIGKSDYAEVISPYNTYLNPGLPPAPICNPSLSAIEAVVDANSNTPYFYYYHDSEGNSHYARTLEEHIENIATYP